MIGGRLVRALAVVFALAGVGLTTEPLLLAQAPPQPTQQCVSTAIAGGTADALTVPLLPCSVTTTLLMLRLSGANTIATPTLQMVGAPAQVIVRNDGTALAVGELASGATQLFTNNGTNWIKLVPPAQTPGAVSVPDNTTLANSAITTYPSGVLRTDFAAGNGAPPEFFSPQVGTCASQSPAQANDGGSCVNASGGGSWKGQLAPEVDVREFGFISTDSGAASAVKLQAASDAIYNLGLPGATLFVPIGGKYTTWAIYTKMSLRCGGKANQLIRTASGKGLYTTDAPGHAWPLAPVSNVSIKDCFFKSENPNSLSGPNVLLAAMDQYALDNVSSVNAGVSGSSLALASIGASFTCTGAGTNVTVTAVVGVIHPGTDDNAHLAGTGVPANTHLVSQTSGTPGGAGVYVSSNATTSSGDACSTTSNKLDTTTVARGSVLAGQMLACDTCGIVATNSYPTVASVDSATVTTLSARFASTLSPRQMATISTWQYTDGNGVRTLPDANLIGLGGVYGFFGGHIRHGTFGYDFIADPTSINGSCGFASSSTVSLNAKTAPVGLFFDSTQNDGGQKYNQNELSDLSLGCNYIGLWIPNGSDNYANGFDCQTGVICVLTGTGSSNAKNNRIERPYCEGWSVADPTITCVMLATGGNVTGTEISGSGSLSRVAWLINPLAGNTATWDVTNYLTYRTGGEFIYSWEPQPNILSVSPDVSNPLHVIPQPMVSGSGITIVGRSNGAAELGVQAWGGGNIPYVHCGFGRGNSLAPIAVGGGDVLCQFDGWGQESTTVGDMVRGAYAQVKTGSPWSVTNRESYWVWATVASATTATVERWWILSDGTFASAGLSPKGAGSINAATYFVGNSTGVDCVIVGATSHLTVSKGLVTLCN